MGSGSTSFIETEEVFSITPFPRRCSLEARASEPCADCAKTLGRCCEKRDSSTRVSHVTSLDVATISRYEWSSSSSLGG